MKVITQLGRDTSNSSPGEAELEAFDGGRWISIKLTGPDREVWIDCAELRYAMGAP